MPRHRNKKTAFAILACIPFLMACLSLCGCLGLSTKVSAAASVNGTVIDEASVTEYIEGFRDEDESRETDSGWAQYLIENGYTAESFRSYVLNTVFIPNTMIALEAADREIVVTDDELDSLIESEKLYYEQRYGADTWDSVLSSFGYNQDSWREKEAVRLLRERLSDQVIDEAEPSESQIQTHASSILGKYSGKHSYFLVFNSLENAQEALSALGGEGAQVAKSAFRKVGKSYAARDDARFEVTGDATAPEYTQADGMVNAGWNSLSSYVMADSPIYTNALNALQEGTLSSVIDLENGTWALIFCNEAYVFQESDIYNLDTTPDEIYKQVLLDVKDLIQEEQFSEWLNDRIKAASVVINSMPSGLPYDVNVSLE